MCLKLKRTEKSAWVHFHNYLFMVTVSAIHKTDRDRAESVFIHLMAVPWCTREYLTHTTAAIIVMEIPLYIFLQRNSKTQTIQGCEYLRSQDFHNT